ncbi:VCBS repeat-containing protein [Acidobacterium sp. S8]|uniref:FG-GAP repeat domain-containing protein n=1 Tax=Acidobacterium sp. S8 TaxID=1641854 RepID=UPI00131C5775|nr:VCBS repeat-containing protein [Acidobacterium sp. S8]
MIRTALKTGRVTCAAMIVFAVAAWTPFRAYAAGFGAGDDDSDDAASRLVVMGDFNRDGVVDIAEATAGGDPTGTGILTVSLGRANGGFQQNASYPIPGHKPRSIAVGDVNGDGVPDVIVGDDDGTVVLFLADGKGSLAQAEEIAHLQSAASIAVADFNHDGRLDFAVADWRSSSVTVFTGAGAGSFERGWSFPLRMPGTSPHLSAADFNGDGIADLAVVYDDDDGDTFDVMLGNGNATFSLAPNLGLVRDPNSHCAT